MSRHLYALRTCDVHTSHMDADTVRNSRETQAAAQRFPQQRRPHGRAPRSPVVERTRCRPRADPRFHQMLTLMRMRRRTKPRRLQRGLDPLPLGALPGAARMQLLSRLPQPREPPPPQCPARAQRAVPEGAPEPGRPRPRKRPGVRRSAESASGGRIRHPQPGAPRPRPGAGLRPGRLRPGGGPLRAGLQYPPPRTAAAPPGAGPGATTNRRLTARPTGPPG